MMSNKQDIVLALCCAVLCSVILNHHEWTILGILAILVAIYFTATLKEPEKVFVSILYLYLLVFAKLRSRQGLYIINSNNVWLQLKPTDEFSVCIIGGGVSGICMGKKLTEAGIKYAHFILISLSQC